MTSKPPIIDRSEYPRRWQAVQRLMSEKNLDLVLTYSDDRATAGAAHARYLADFPPHFEPVIVLIPSSGEPMLLCGPESEGYAGLVGRLKDIRVLRELTHPDEDYPYTRIFGFEEIVKEFCRGERVERVGVGGLGAIGERLLTSLRRALPEAEWVDAEASLCGLRAIKSASEIKVIEYAYRIAELGMEAAISAIKPGVSERSVAAEAEYAMRMAGAEGVGIDTIVASGPNSGPVLARTTQRRIGGDDLVLVTLAPRYEGYHGAIGRPIVVGDPGEDVVRAVEAAYLAQLECGKALRSGVVGRNVEAIGRRVMDEAGFGGGFLYSGIHSVGVVEFEPPIFGPGSLEVIRDNMVVSVDIPVFGASWGGLRVEDGYLIQGDGCRRLDASVSARK